MPRRQLSSRGRLALLAASVAISLAFSASALTAGGASIATAPPVVLGQQEFGNNASHPADASGNHWEFWRLQLVTGDRVRIDWEETAGAQVAEHMYVPSVTDFNFAGSQYKYGQGAGPNNKNEQLVMATQSGTWTLAFGSDSQATPGPYDFVVTLQHAVRVYLPLITSVSRRGTLRVQVHAPDGTAISGPGLELTLMGTWAHVAHVLGHAHPANGVVVFRLALPASLHGSMVTVRVRASGAAYLAALSAARRVSIN